MDQESSKTLAQAVAEHDKGHLSVAEALYRRAIETHPNSLDAKNRYAVLLLQLGRHSDALIQLNSSLGQDGKQTDVLANAAYAWNAMGVPEKGKELAERALKIDPTFLPAIRNEIQSNVQLGKYEEAAKGLELGVGYYPSDGSLAEQHAYILAKHLRHSRIAQNFKKLLKLHPGNDVVWAYYGAFLHKERSYSEAENAYKRALALDSRNNIAALNLGVLYSETDRHLAALNQFEESFRLDPNDPSLWFNLGVCWDGLNAPSKAIVAYDKAIELDPGFTEASLNKAIDLQKIGELDRARELLVDLTARHPTLVKSWTMLGKVLNQANRFFEAIFALDKALLLDPTDTEALSEKGVSLTATGSAHTALDLQRRAIERGALLPKVQLDLGNTLIALGHYGEAEDHFRRALDLDPECYEAKLNLALLMLAQGRYEAGFQHYEWRWRTNQHLGLPRIRNIPYWDGIRGHDRLYVWGEQGLGDQIVFGSLLGSLKTLYSDLTVALDHRLITLFARAHPEIKFTSLADELNTSRFDRQVSLADLGLVLMAGEIKINEPHPPQARLAAHPDRVRQLQASLAEFEKPWIGVSWKSFAMKIGADKSVATKEFANYLSKRHPHATFISLQYGDVDLDASNLLEHGCKLVRLPELDLREDIDGLAALIAVCDEVVTVSNVTAHVAGALNRPTTVLTPRNQSRLWYWGIDGLFGPWHPSCKLLKPKMKESI